MVTVRSWGQQSRLLVECRRLTTALSPAATGGREGTGSPPQHQDPSSLFSPQHQHQHLTQQLRPRVPTGQHKCELRQFWCELLPGGSACEGQFVDLSLLPTDGTHLSKHIWAANTSSPYRDKDWRAEEREKICFHFMLSTPFCVASCFLSALIHSVSPARVTQQKGKKKKSLLAVNK